MCLDGTKGPFTLSASAVSLFYFFWQFVFFTLQSELVQSGHNRFLHHSIFNDFFLKSGTTYFHWEKKKLNDRIYRPV